MRIIAGIAKGRRLRAVPGSDVRPTSDRVKESVFNVLASWLPDKRVLDLFAGTGSLGLEALSRDAASCHFVDRSAKSLQCARDNADDLGFQDLARFTKAEALPFLKRYRGEPFDVIFMDPPYANVEEWVALLKVSASVLVAEGGRVVAEHPGTFSLPPVPGWQVSDRRNYGTTSITFLDPISLMTTTTQPDTPKDTR